VLLSLLYPLLYCEISESEAALTPWCLELLCSVFVEPKNTQKTAECPEKKESILRCVCDEFPLLYAIDFSLCSPESAYDKVHGFCWSERRVLQRKYWTQRTWRRVFLAFQLLQHCERTFRVAFLDVPIEDSVARAQQFYSEKLGFIHCMGRGELCLLKTWEQNSQATMRCVRSLECRNTLSVLKRSLLRNYVWHRGERSLHM
jgi:hypothetical protein